MAWLLRTHVLHGDTAPFASDCASRARNDIPNKAGPKQHVNGITAPERIIRLCPVVLARSTIKPRPRKRTVSANPCSVFTNMPLATLSHKRAHLCWRKDALPMTQRPIWNGEPVCATNGFQRRCDNQRKMNEVTCAKRKPRPAIKLSTPKCAST